MPLYDYACMNCGAAFDAARRVAERDTAPCPACHEPARKRFTPTAQFLIPARFGLTAGWNLLQPGEAGYESQRLMSRDSVRARPARTFQDVVGQNLKEAGLA